MFVAKSRFVTVVDIKREYSTIIPLERVEHPGILFSSRGNRHLILSRGE